MNTDRRKSEEQIESDEGAEEYLPLHCKSCGSTDVRWRLQGGEWTMFSMQPGILHVCDTSEDFE